MNAERLLALYERIADAPDAVARLRRFILDLAVRGKLVPQDPNNEPASELLKRIENELKRLPQARKPRGRANTSTPAKGKLPFGLPRSWSWAKFYEVATVQSNLVDPGAYSSHPLVAPDNIESRTGKLLPYGTVADSGVFSPKHLFKPGCLLYSKIRPALAKVASVDFEGLCSADMYPLTTKIHREYLHRYMLADVFVDQSVTEDNRVAMPKINQQALSEILVAVPPLAEQHRIVAKVDELMVLCDRLEKAREQREAARDRFTAAALVRLNVPDPETFRTEAQFALNTLTTLTNRSNQIRHFRQAILDLAVHGKLVPQDANDEPAHELLARIADEKAEELSERRIRQPLVSLRTEKTDLPSSLPKSWATTSLRSIALVTDPNPSHRYPSYVGGTVPLLSTREFEGISGWDPSTAKLVPEDVYQLQKNLCRFTERDIVFARKGRLGLPRYLPSLNKFTFSHTLFILRPMDSICADYLLWYLRREWVIGWLTQEMNQNTGVPTLGKEKLEALPITIPPQAEQVRIVARINMLMQLCNQLEESLTRRDDTRRRLLEAVLVEALAPARDREMQAAE